MSVLVAFLVLQGGAKGIQREIQARYDALDQAFRMRNSSVLDTFMTDDFTSDSPDGKKLDRASALSSFKGLLAGAQHAKWPRKIVRLRVEGSDFIATVTGNFDGEFGGPGGKAHRMELASTVEDTWMRTPEGWRIRRSHMIQLIMKRDGKPIAR